MDPFKALMIDFIIQSSLEFDSLPLSIKAKFNKSTNRLPFSFFAHGRISGKQFSTSWEEIHEQNLCGWHWLRWSGYRYLFCGFG
jgi:hypothetical protein